MVDKRLWIGIPVVSIMCISLLLVLYCTRDADHSAKTSMVNPCNCDTIGYRFYEAYQYDTALFYFHKTLTCYQEKNLSVETHPRWFGKTFQYMADAWYAIGDFDSALHYYQKAVWLYMDASDSLKYPENLNSAGTCYAIQGAYLYQNMGIICSDQCKYEQAIDYYIKARYENEKALRKIENLNQQTVLQQQKIQSRETMLWLSGALLIVMMAFFIVMIKQYKLTARFEKLDLEQRLLRAQLRPHFIFNVLNSLKFYIQSGQTEASLTHLSCFARVMRKMLHQTSQDEILLQDELDMLYDYLLLESTKFSNELAYTIEVDENINSLALGIPPFLVQPYVENSLVHGFVGKQGDKLIRIRVMPSTFSDVFLISISDNGKGIDHTKMFKNTNSMGGAITARRIAYFNRVNGYHGKAVEVRANTNNGMSEGITVNLHIARKTFMNHDKSHYN